MKNRERDRVSERSKPTEAGRLNRDVSEEKGRERNSGTSAEFGQSIGRAENLSEGGEMRDRKSERNMNRNTGLDSESTRRPGSEGYDSSSGRRPSEMENDKSDVSRDDRSPGRGGNGSIGRTGSSEGRH